MGAGGLFFELLGLKFHDCFVFQKQYTLLMCSARNNRLEVVNFLLDNLDRVDLDAVDMDHQTALHHAALGGHIEIVQKLVHVGANPTTVDKVIVTITDPLYGSIRLMGGFQGMFRGKIFAALKSQYSHKSYFTY